MQRELSSFPLPATHRFKLHSAGFSTVEDIINMRPSQLSQELELSAEEALGIIEMVKAQMTTLKKPAGRQTSALQMLRDEQLQQSIVSFSERIDSLLGSGLPLASVTELCGPPGVGKTQLALQWAVDAAIPECCGGVGGEAIFIDTEGSFVIDRLVDIANATVQHCHQMADNTEQAAALKSFSLESLLAGVYYYRILDYVQLLALVQVLPEFIKEHPKVRYIVIDSIAFHFRHDFEDYALRTRLLNRISQALQKLAVDGRIAVLLTNQMTTRVSTNQGAGGSTELIPALGESWGHACTTRLVLHWRQNERRASLYKSPSQPEATVSYQITTGGIRDVCDNNANTSHQDVSDR